MHEIKSNIRAIYARIEQACARVKRDPAGVVLVAVTKARSTEEIAQVIAAGAADIGENRVQEALLKYHDKRLAISDKPMRWHMVGHLQTNKVKEALGIFDLIHSVDSLRLATEIDKQAARINKIQDILIEVKTSPEATKSGVLPEDAAGLLKQLLQFKNIAVKGLMTIAPLVSSPEESRPYFWRLRELRDKLTTNDQRLTTISMGMTDDFEVAIEEGATMLRIGRAIFES